MLRWRMRQVCGAYPLDKVIRKRLPEKGVIQPLCLIRGESQNHALLLALISIASRAETFTECLLTMRRAREGQGIGLLHARELLPRPRAGSYLLPKFLSLHLPRPPGESGKLRV